MTSLALAAALWFAAPASAEPGLDAKVRFERSIEHRLEGLLEEILGPRRVRVFLDATLDQSMSEEMVAKAADDVDAGETLPGYGARRNVKKTSAAKSPVQKLSVTVVLDPGVSESELQGVIATVTEVLALDSARGDQLRVARAPLAPSLAKTLADPGLWRLAAYLAVGAGALLLFMPLLFASARRAWVRGFRQIRASDWQVLPSAGVVQALPAGGLPLLPEGTGALELSFIRPRNLKAVARFLENRPPAASRVILGSLDSDRAAALFRLLSDRLRAGAASDMIQGGQPTPDQLDRLESELRDFVAREDGGPGLLQRLLVRTPVEARQGVLEFLRARLPGPAKNVEAGLIAFEDLARADAPSLRELAALVTSEEWSLALNGASAGLRDYLLSVLPPVFRERIKRRLEASAGLSQDASMAARAAIIGRWKDLEASGKVRPLP